MTEPEELTGMPEPLVRQVDMLTGTLNDVFTKEDELPNIGDTFKLGGHLFTCRSITEKAKDDNPVFTCTWQLS